MTSEEFKAEAESVLQEWLDGAYTYPGDGSPQYRISQMEDNGGEMLFRAKPLDGSETKLFEVKIVVTEVGAAEATEPELMPVVDGRPLF